MAFITPAPPESWFTRTQIGYLVCLGALQLLIKLEIIWSSQNAEELLSVRSLPKRSGPCLYALLITNSGGPERDTADGYLLRPPWNLMNHRTLGPRIMVRSGRMNWAKLSFQEDNWYYVTSHTIPRRHARCAGIVNPTLCIILLPHSFTIL